MAYSRGRICLALLLCLLACGARAEYDAQTAQQWLSSFAAQAAGFPVRNDAELTADPARAGEYLIEYDFGTVTAKRPSAPEAGEILRIELTGDAVSDCRGLRVGDSLEDVIGGRQIGRSDTPLYVLETQDAGYGWSWAYVSESGVYGVEYITYGEDGPAMKEYTLTYVIRSGVIDSIRMQIAQATLAQAQEGLSTAEEIAGRQQGERLAAENAQAAFSQQDMVLAGRRALGVAVEELIALLGEPQEIQALPDGMGRMLVYPALVAELAFEERTGVERVRALSCTSAGIAGPRGLRAGMSIEEAAALWRCDQDVTTTGGALYLAGEAQGIAPYGELVRDGAGAYTLRYACIADGGAHGVLEIGTADGAVTHWRMYLEQTEAEYDG